MDILNTHQFRSCLLILSFAIFGATIATAFEKEQKSSRKRFEELLKRADVKPHWLPGSKGFWYYRRDDSGTFEFTFVNAQTGKIKSSLDPKELGLPASRDLRTTSMRPAKEGRSRSGGQACNLTFVNRLPRPVELNWINPSGDAVPFGSISPGASKAQSTYEGHLWSLDDAAGRQLARISADPLKTKILIDGPSRSTGRREEDKTKESLPPGMSPDHTWMVQYKGRKVEINQLKKKQSAVVELPGTDSERLYGDVEWSPRSDAFVISLTSPVKTREITVGKALSPDHPDGDVHSIRYAKPGDPLPQPTPVLFRLKGDRFEPVDVDRELFPNQFTSSNAHDYTWARDGSEFYFNYNQRGHQCYRILAVNAHSGKVRSVVEETSPTFIDYTKKTWRHWLPNTKEVLWLSERTGWCHLWKFDVTGQFPPQQLTTGNWVVREVEEIDEANKTIWFTASGLNAGEDPYHIHLCRVQFDGTGFKQLTTGDGTHEIEFSPDGNLFVDTWSRIDLPPVVELRRSNGELVCEVNNVSESEFAEFKGLLPERFVAKGRDGKTDIYGMIIKPSNFDPARKYPILENIYAGPHGAFVPKTFGSHSGMQKMADLGFIIVKMDGMGTNFRGKAFHDVCWKNLKDSGFPDRITWIKAAAATRPWMDLSRVGVYGGSAGGQSALRALLDHGDFYKVGVADCGCHDNRVDKMWWNEQWMGWPIDDSYAHSSNVDDAAKLTGKLLLIVGEADENVDPDSTLQVVKALNDAGKKFDFLPLPKTGHGAAETPAGSEARERFLKQHLLPAEAP